MLRSVSVGIFFACILCLAQSSDRCEVTDTWSSSTTFKDHLDFSFACAPERLMISFSGGSLDGEFFHFQRFQRKYLIMTRRSMTKHRIPSGSSNWTLTLSSTKGVLLVDLTMSMTLPIFLPKGRVGVCYKVQFESNGLDLSVSRGEGGAPCDVLTTTTTTPPPITTTKTSLKAAKAISKRRRGSARTARDPPRTSGLLPNADPDLEGKEIPAAEAEAWEDGAEWDVGCILLVAAVIAFI
ncbi:uncharacterized protein LOC134779033 [Penaeus indicus]|uniref:uncharacterized protein LOC134779033 n=1 Tax=Penaeus indicus TaxID=29960 RepID=UPI00300D78C3